MDFVHEDRRDGEGGEKGVLNGEVLNLMELFVNYSLDEEVLLAMKDAVGGQCV